MLSSCSVVPTAQSGPCLFPVLLLSTAHCHARVPQSTQFPPPPWPPSLRPPPCLQSPVFLPSQANGCSRFRTWPAVSCPQAASYPGSEHMPDSWPDLEFCRSKHLLLYSHPRPCRECGTESCQQVSATHVNLFLHIYYDLFAHAPKGFRVFFFFNK